MPTYSAAASIPATDKDVPLSLFGGLNTELAPTDLPEGGSPDSNDVEFLPGSVHTRRGLHKVLSVPCPGPIYYLKTYLQPNGKPLNLFSDALGNLWVEDPVNSPGTKTLLRAGIPGTYNSSVTAFGREYIANNDTQVGADIPLQYDGTNLDRVSQDGVGAPPTLSDAQVNTQTLTSITPEPQLTISNTIQTGTLMTITTTTAHGLVVNDSVIVQTGNVVIDNYSQPILVQEVSSSTSFSYEVGVPDLPSFTGGTVQNLAVRLLLPTAHGMIVGDSFTIQGTGTSYDNNYNNVVNGTPVALAQIFQTDTNVTVATVVTAAAHGYQPGTIVTIDVGNASYDQSGTLFPLLTVDSPTVFTYDTGYTGLPSLTSGGAFTVTQRIDVNSPPTWRVRTVSASNTLTFTCVDVSGGTVTSGTFKGGGLSSEGAHQCVVMFLTRQGYITAPSSPVTFTSFGSRKYSISNIPIGPPNVTARILAFTGSGGDNFFYIPTTPMGADILGNRVPIGTSTLVNDNTSTTATLDFADDTLFAATAIDIPGNNLFAQVVLGPCLSFAAYGSRLLAWGERNKVQNFVNMGFAGGYHVLTTPLGWTNGTGGGTLVNSDVGMCWKVSGNPVGASGNIFQGAYQDWTGTPILSPNQAYSLRFRALVSNVGDPGYVFGHFLSVSTGLSSDAVFNLFGISATGRTFYQADFDTPLPAVIPSDMKFTLSVVNQTTGHWTELDEIEIIPQQSPLMNNVCRGSYVNNPEAFDGVTGTFGPSDDPSPMQCMTLIRNNLILHSAEGTFSTADNLSEPGDWVINTVSRAVGALSFRGCDASKTGTGDAGEQWELVAAKAGLYLFAGGDFFKVSQEIQSVWDGINYSARGTIWVKNDTQAKCAYIGLPLGTSPVPSNVYVMNYRDLDTGSQIGTAPAVKIGFSGRMIATDVSRKWTNWNIPGTCGQIVDLPTPTLCLGSNSFGNFYYLDSAKLTDDDHGQIFSNWTSYFFVNHDQEMQLGVGSHVKLIAYLTALVQGTGRIMVIPFVNSLQNPWPATPFLPLSSVPTQDLEIPTNTLGERVAFKIVVAPNAGQTDAYFNLQKLVVTIRENTWWPVRGMI